MSNVFILGILGFVIGGLLAIKILIFSCRYVVQDSMENDMALSVLYAFCDKYESEGDTTENGLVAKALDEVLQAFANVRHPLPIDIERKKK